MQATTPAIDKKIFCGICEASCGLIATVQDGEILKLRGDPDHPQSQGFICPKGASFASIRNDPDRILRPLQRQADGSFREVDWDTALDDIGARLRAGIKHHGRESLGVYLGNPNAWNFGAFLFLVGFAAALKTRHFYSPGSLDINNYRVAGQLLYGHNLSNPFPDLAHTRFFLVLGANPVVSHGSMLTAGRIKEQMQAVVARGGRVVVWWSTRAAARPRASSNGARSGPMATPGCSRRCSRPCSTKTASITPRCARRPPAPRRCPNGSLTSTARVSRPRPAWPTPTSSSSRATSPPPNSA